MPTRLRDVLLVDDSRADRRFITRELKRCGSPYHVDTADTVASARKMLMRKHYDCVLLDYSLPDSDGLSLMEGMNNTPGNGTTGIVMITGEGNEKIAAQAIKLGAFEYLSKKQIDGRRLSSALDRAIEHSRAKRTLEHQRVVMENFASSAAHDLANPLSGVIGFLTLAQQGLEKKQLDRLPTYIENAMTSALYMKQLVTDLLHYARTGTSADNAEHIDLNDTVDTAINVLDKAIREAGAKITVGPLPTLEIYPTELVQLFQNLIGNALKYRSAALPCIEISAEENDDHWVITVADNGVGVPEKFREDIFVPLHRLFNENVEGSGLGLAICTKIMDLHHGDIWCESREEGGSEFKFSLPKNLTQEENTGAA
ncbi:hybrid sensor histidine kinase/response regulator [Kordiimonas aestuarii]|uniref:hybrid sensor histidine kinase/response regulator n=1 Tax=Kordiimonas aestuarii TaxID=1005925 RepID=UPI0021D3E96F|nr:hybrid sensor histidine kinase/response regulator [Kordiimonas aestuarii]